MRNRRDLSGVVLSFPKIFYSTCHCCPSILHVRLCTPFAPFPLPHCRGYLDPWKKQTPQSSQSKFPIIIMNPHPHLLSSQITQRWCSVIQSIQSIFLGSGSHTPRLLLRAPNRIPLTPTPLHPQITHLLIHTLALQNLQRRSPLRHARPAILPAFPHLHL